MRGRRIATTRRGKRAAPAKDLVRRNFQATKTDKIWVADITYVATREGFLYLAFILDAHSRRIVGWAMENHLRTEIVVDALQMAVWRRKPAPGLVHHSDQGVQGGFNRSKQHQPREVLSWDDHQAGPHGSQDGRPCVLRGLRGSAISASVSESSGMPSLRGSAARTPERVSASQVQSQRVGSAILAE
jgi:transposase InsO family protein